MGFSYDQVYIIDPKRAHDWKGTVEKWYQEPLLTYLKPHRNTKSTIVTYSLREPLLFWRNVAARVITGPIVQWRLHNYPSSSLAQPCRAISGTAPQSTRLLFRELLFNVALSFSSLSHLVIKIRLYLHLASSE